MELTVLIIVIIIVMTAVGLQEDHISRFKDLATIQATCRKEKKRLQRLLVIFHKNKT